MKRGILSLFVLLLLAAGVATLVAVTGCDEAPGLGWLIIEPAYIDLTLGSNVVEFVISTNSQGSALGLPLEWLVTDTSLGRIVGAGGYRALYVRYSANGMNTIIARDQYDNEGFATVRQMVEQYGLTLVATPESIPPGSLLTSVTVQTDDDAGTPDGTAPYTWNVLYPAAGAIIAGQGTDTVVYRSNGVGVNVVQCTDALGVTGSIIVEQE